MKCLASVPVEKYDIHSNIYASESKIILQNRFHMEPYDILDSWEF